VLSAGPLRVDLAARGVGEGMVVVEGGLAIEVTMPCSRCLKPVRVSVDVPFREHFKVSQEPQTEEEADRFIAVKDNDVDLTPYVEEAVQLELPLVPLCAEDCKGLCPECGTDLNEGECGCDRTPVDPRLAALKDLFPR
jgi:Predicted metal-binding, possibly nucleic acid-binding protein